MAVGMWVIITLFGSGVISGLATMISRLGRLQMEEEISSKPYLFFYHYVWQWILPEKKWEGVLFSIQLGRTLLHVLYAVLMFFWITHSHTGPLIFKGAVASAQSGGALYLIEIAFVTALIALLTDFLFQIPAMLEPKGFYPFYSLTSSIFLTIFSPILLLLSKLSRWIESPLEQKSPSLSSHTVKRKLLSILEEAKISTKLDPNDEKQIISFLTFKDRIVREVMVPRVNIMTLSAKTPVRDAITSFAEEGYSRIPVYEENVDQIIGVLLYKDLLKEMALYKGDKNLATFLESPIEGILKPVVYTPETKKISQLLQEFRHKQVHMAIVVDEYGGTEGIITFEDILEELVGNIEDESDYDTEVLFNPHPAGGWIVDAKMSILDLEKELGVQLPFSPEYDTLGGYVFHKAGTIPSKGWRIHHQEFDLEVISSSERALEKLRINPLKQHDDDL